MDSFRILFASHSGKIESKEIAYHDTREIFENGKVVGYTGDPRALFELQNQKVCYDFLKSRIIEKEPLSILEIHRILTAGVYDERRYLRPGCNYCGDPAPNNEEGKTCREAGSAKSFRAKVLNNEVWAVHQRAYKKHFARTRKRTMRRAEFEVWEQKSEQFREEALAQYDQTAATEERQKIVDKLTEELNKV